LVLISGEVADTSVVGWFVAFPTGIATMGSIEDIGFLGESLPVVSPPLEGLASQSNS